MRGFLILLYRVLLWLQPRAVRLRYGSEMLALIEQQTLENTAVSVWVSQFADLLISSVRARKLAFGWTLISSGIGHTLYAAWSYPHSTMGIGAVLLTASLLVTGSLMVRHDYDVV
jgi:hypothetical protein